MFYNFPKKWFRALVLILSLFLLHMTLKNETKYKFKNQDYGKFIRYECVAALCGGWGKKLMFSIVN